MKFLKKAQNRYLDFLISPCYQGVKRLFVLSCENKAGRIGYTHKILFSFSNCRNKRLQCYDWWKKPFPNKDHVRHTKTVEKLILVKEMISQLVFY